MMNKPKNGRAFLATVKVLVKEEACESKAGACDWFSGLLSENPDVVDWAYAQKKPDGPKKVRVPTGYSEGDLSLMREDTMYDTFKVECPHCGSDNIAVTEATLAATGERLRLGATLHPDGFEVPAPDDVRDASTEDEVARCGECGKEFPLADLLTD